MSKEQDSRVAQSKHRLPVPARQWHKWGGLVAGVFLLSVGSTGMVLNYKQPIFSSLGIELKRERDASPLPKSKSPGEVTLTSGAGVAGGMVGFEQALAIARAEWGDVPLERIELRSEPGTVTYRFRQKGGAELWVDAADGRRIVKGEYERLGRPGADGAVARTTDWGKILIDLHTGKIGGGIGKALITFAAALLLLLTLSGFYLWLKPLLIKRSKAGPQTADNLSQVGGSGDLSST